MEAEYYALAEGLRVASIHSNTREYCEAYSDAKPLIDKMCGSERLPDDWDDYYTTCHWLLDKFDKWDLYHCNREQNKTAHDLAREALQEGRQEI